MVDAVPVQRIVPGAPPPLPVSKSQKKKRKAVSKPRADDAPASVSIPDSTAAALVEKAPEPADIKQGAVAEELVAAPQELLPEMPAEKPKSPTIEFLNKRIKLQTKKIVSIFGSFGRDRAVSWCCAWNCSLALRAVCLGCWITKAVLYTKLSNFTFPLSPV